ncbi:MAG TPA: DUF3667 domain-containing protein [Longimicrobium sp.]|nr:DUF3667 domain-containing protein [Longimicrobium sp.]
MSAPLGGAEAGEARPACANCGTELMGAFCHACGQERGPGAVTLRALVAEVADEVLSLDGRFVRTFRTLLFRPGVLTREYLAGHRVGYFSPFRLYLLVSAAHLALVAATGATSFFFFTVSGSRGATGKAMALLPRLMFVLLPLFALLLHVLHRRPRRMFVEHFVFALHFHTAAFIVATAHILLVPLTTGASALRPAAIVLDAGVQLYLLAYLYRALRVVYGGSRTVACVKMALLLAGYAAALLLALVAHIRLLKYV